MSGVGERDLKLEAHFELSASMRGRRLGEDVGRSRRAIAWTVGLEEREVRVVRMWEPYDLA